MTMLISPSSTAPRISSGWRASANLASSTFHARSIVTMIAAAAAGRYWPVPARAPSSTMTIRAADVVSSSDLSLAIDWWLSSHTSSSTPIMAATTNGGPSIIASVPVSDVMANVRTPTSLSAHSRSSPTSRPAPKDTAIFNASAR